MVDPPDITGWLSVSEAAQAYGWNARTVRRKIASGELAAHQVSGKFGPEWRIEPPPGYEAPAPAVPGTAPPVSTPTPGQAMIPLDSLERLLQPLAGERDRLLGELQAARGEIAELQTARLEDREEIGRLKGLLEAAQPPLESAPVPAPEPRRRRWPWQR